MRIRRKIRNVSYSTLGCADMKLGCAFLTAEAEVATHVFRNQSISQ